MKVGDKVVCVYNGWRYNGPKHGDIVTIERVFTGYMYYVFFELAEYTDRMNDGCRVNFNSIRFRPVDYSFGEKVCEEIVKQTEQVAMPTINKYRAKVNWDTGPSKAKRDQKISSVYSKGNDIAFTKGYEDFLPKCTKNAKPLF